MRKTVLTAVILLLAGCGRSATASPPSARALVAKMGCAVLAQGSRFAGYDLAQDLRTQGPAPGCPGGEVYTFPSQKAETDWLHQAQASSQQTVTTIYPWIVVGHLWAVQPGDESAMAQVAARLHGQQVSF